ncbi:MAG: hypothetical protein HZB67_04160, partial [Candidatus Aenigmarchaeota archaeon]|nr:hypothetical protein [Candidatus Aenigmarchaeota archaeon]
GFFSEELADILPAIDYIVMDVKTRFEPDAYKEITGYAGDKELLFSKILKSIAFIEKRDHGLFKEFRTTVIPGFNDTPETIENIAKQVSFATQYTLQQFTPNYGTISPHFRDIPLTSREKLLELAKVAKKTIELVAIRTAEKGEELV